MRSLNGQDKAPHFNGTERIARVGNEYIMAGDILPEIDEFIATHPEIPADEIDNQRMLMLKAKLPQKIETKLLFEAAKKKFPKEALPKIEADLNKKYDEEMLPKKIAAAKVKNKKELEELFRKNGTTIAANRRTYFEQAVAGEMVHVHAKKKMEAPVTLDDMLYYYHEHLKDYTTPARVRWEQIRVRFDRHASKEEAWHDLATWGNAVMEGIPFATVASAHSEDPSGSDGGKHGWTSKGSLVSKELDEALFLLPLGTLSPIIEDDRGLSIVRVIEREEMVRKPFADAQVEIKKKLQEHDMNAECEAFLAELRGKTRIWTIFDPPETTTVASGQTQSPPR